MVRGCFKTFEHDHFFDVVGGGTRMRDVVSFESPLGLLGRCVDYLALARYLGHLLEERNRMIRCEAEHRRGRN